MGIFQEWHDDIYAMRWEARLNWIVGLLSALVLAFNLNNPELGLPALLMAIFALTRGTLGLLESVKEKHPILSIASFGSESKMLIGGIAGIAISLFLVSDFHLAIPNMSLSTIDLLPGVAVSTGFLFTCVLSPVIEEFFFRGLLLFTFQKIQLIPGIRSMHVYAVIVSGVFAWFHFVAYNANEPAMIVAFIMSMIWIYGNFFFGSLAFGMASHFVFNFISFRG